MQSPGQKPWDTWVPLRFRPDRRLPHILPRRCSIQGSLWPETNAWRFLQAPTWRYIDLDMGWYGMIWVWAGSKFLQTKTTTLPRDIRQSIHFDSHIRIIPCLNALTITLILESQQPQTVCTNWLLLSPLCRQWASQDAENLCKQCVSLQSSLVLWVKTHGIPWFKVVVDIHPPNIL